MCLTLFSNAAIRLPKLIRDSMILQRDQPLNIWGWADVAEPVSVQFNGKTYRTKTNKDGRWTIHLPSQPAGGPFSMTIKGKERIVLKDILIGDVWFCSGQSNMVHQLNIHDVTYAQDIESANYPMIRQFWVPPNPQLAGPVEDLPYGNWKAAIGNDVRPFSAVAYFFARKIYQQTGVPIGIINASIGGTPIEAWTSEEGLKQLPYFNQTITDNKDTATVNAHNRAIAAILNKPVIVKDKGLLENIKWYDPRYVPVGWRTIYVPGYWEDQGVKDLNGVVWYRKTFTVPVSMVGKSAKLFLGRIVDADIVYINGIEVGKTSYMYPQRRYPISATVLKAGTNIITVRVTNQINKGGFVPDKPYYLFSGTDTIELSGKWSYKVGEAYSLQPAGQQPISLQNQPTALYNGMVAPILPYAIKGVLWYQGESNGSRPEQYESLQKAQIKDWRTKWASPELPFLYVQLPGYMDYTYLPVESNWARLREAQRKALGDKNVAMAVTIDLGEWNDVHPDNKKAVGDRLALLAENMLYGKDQLASGPSLKTVIKQGDTIRIQFHFTGSGLRSNDGEYIRSFAIAGSDKRFYWAEAKIVGDEIWIRSDEVKQPKIIRYGWADCPDVNLINAEGFPAIPFEVIIPEN